jgi:hypothetical protein
MNTWKYQRINLSYKSIIPFWQHAYRLILVDIGRNRQLLGKIVSAKKEPAKAANLGKLFMIGI